MVRLEAGAAIAGAAALAFQFHYGTIRRTKRIFSLQQPLHFNSTMVRLEVFDDTAKCEELIFQFHYGTIRRETEWLTALVL